MYIDVRFTRGQLQALIASLDCLMAGQYGETLWWKKMPHERQTLEALRLRLETELELLE